MQTVKFLGIHKILSATTAVNGKCVILLEVELA